MLFPLIVPRLSSPTSFLRTRQLEDLGTRTTGKILNDHVDKQLILIFMGTSREIIS